jgi:hypothetical protein
MSLLRGIAVWIGAALMASFLCTVLWSVVVPGQMTDRRVAVSIGIASLFFTLIGSALISGLFAGMSARPTRHRRLILVGLSCLLAAR